MALSSMTHFQHLFVCRLGTVVLRTLKDPSLLGVLAQTPSLFIRLSSHTPGHFSCACGLKEGSFLLTLALQPMTPASPPHLSF